MNTHYLNRQEKKYQRRKAVTPYTNFQHQADLAEFLLLKKHNKGYQFLLLVVDVFSRFGYAKPEKSKNLIAVIKAFEIFTDGPLPLFICKPTAEPNLLTRH